jgi:hypothetical protein
VGTTNVLNRTYISDLFATALNKKQTVRDLSTRERVKRKQLLHWYELWRAIAKNKKAETIPKTKKTITHTATRRGDKTENERITVTRLMMFFKKEKPELRTYFGLPRANQRGGPNDLHGSKDELLEMGDEVTNITIETRGGEDAERETMKIEEATTNDMVINWLKEHGKSRGWKEPVTINLNRRNVWPFIFFRALRDHRREAVHGRERGHDIARTIEVLRNTKDETKPPRDEKQNRGMTNREAPAANNDDEGPNDGKSDKSQQNKTQSPTPLLQLPKIPRFLSDDAMDVDATTIREVKLNKHTLRLHFAQKATMCGKQYVGVFHFLRLLLAAKDPLFLQPPGERKRRARTRPSESQKGLLKTGVSHYQFLRRQLAKHPNILVPRCW